MFSRGAISRSFNAPHGMRINQAVRDQASRLWRKSFSTGRLRHSSSEGAIARQPVVLKEGYLSKPSFFRFGGKKRRWCVLRKFSPSEASIDMYVDDTKTRYKGSISLDRDAGPILIVKNADKKRKVARQCYFTIKVGKGTFQFTCDSFRELTEWCALIRQAMDVGTTFSGLIIEPDNISEGPVNIKFTTNCILVVCPIKEAALKTWLLHKVTSFGQCGGMFTFEVCSHCSDHSSSVPRCSINLLQEKPTIILNLLERAIRNNPNTSEIHYERSILGDIYHCAHDCTQPGRLMPAYSDPNIFSSGGSFSPPRTPVASVEVHTTDQVESIDSGLPGTPQPEELSNGIPSPTSSYRSNPFRSPRHQFHYPRSPTGEDEAERRPVFRRRQSDEPPSRRRSDNLPLSPSYSTVRTTEGSPVKPTVPNNGRVEYALIDHSAPSRMLRPLDNHTTPTRIIRPSEDHTTPTRMVRSPENRTRMVHPTEDHARMVPPIEDHTSPKRIVRPTEDHTTPTRMVRSPKDHTTPLKMIRPRENHTTPTRMVRSPEDHTTPTRMVRPLDYSRESHQTPTSIPTVTSSEAPMLYTPEQDPTERRSNYNKLKTLEESTAEEFTEAVDDVIYDVPNCEFLSDPFQPSPVPPKTDTSSATKSPVHHILSPSPHHVKTSPTSSPAVLSPSHQAVHYTAGADVQDRKEDYAVAWVSPLPRRKGKSRQREVQRTPRPKNHVLAVRDTGSRKRFQSSSDVLDAPISSSVGSRWQDMGRNGTTHNHRPRTASVVLNGSDRHLDQASNDFLKRLNEEEEKLSKVLAASRREKNEEMLEEARDRVGDLDKPYMFTMDDLDHDYSDPDTILETCSNLVDYQSTRSQPSYLSSRMLPVRKEPMNNIKGYAYKVTIPFTNTQYDVPRRAAAAPDLTTMSHDAPPKPRRHVSTEHLYFMNS